MPKWEKGPKPVAECLSLLSQTSPANWKVELSEKHELFQIISTFSQRPRYVFAVAMECCCYYSQIQKILQQKVVTDCDSDIPVVIL